MLRQSLTSVALAACLALGATACSDDGGSTTDASSKTTMGHMGESDNSTPEVDDSMIDGVEQFSDLSRDHVGGTVEYDQTPPVGGAHSSVWQTCGFYSEPIITEQGVHSMEHGAVWITYQSSLSAGEQSALEAIADDNDYVLVSPWPGDDLPSPIVASAWGLQLVLDSTDDPRLAEFVDTYANGPQTPEPGAPCDGGDTQSAQAG